MVGAPLDDGGRREQPRLTYPLAWESLAEREKRWAALLADPQWVATSAETEKDGPLVQHISNALLAPTAFPR